MENLSRLVYVSAAKALFSKAELLALLLQAREKNERSGITGMLLYKEGNFMQLIEGDNIAIHALFSAITADSRHHQSMLILDEPTEERLFTDWTMGFYDLSDTDLTSLPGFSPFMNRRLGADHFKNDPSGCLELFKLFRDNC